MQSARFDFGRCQRIENSLKTTSAGRFVMLRIIVTEEVCCTWWKIAFFATKNSDRVRDPTIMDEMLQFKEAN